MGLVNCSYKQHILNSTFWLYCTFDVCHKDILMSQEAVNILKSIFFIGIRIFDTFLTLFISFIADIG